MPNYNEKTGIHYGVISIHDIIEAWCEKSLPYEPDGLPADDLENFEPDEFYVDNKEYKAQTGLEGEIMCIESPYYTRCRRCSPCYPNAGDLNTPDDEYGMRTYCFGHDWFDNGVAPYRVYRVSDNTIVEGKTE